LRRLVLAPAQSPAQPLRTACAPCALPAQSPAQPITPCALPAHCLRTPCAPCTYCCTYGMNLTNGQINPLQVRKSFSKNLPVIYSLPILSFPPLQGMYAHVGPLPIREWLLDAAAETAAKGYSRVGSWETFEVEPCSVFFRPLLYFTTPLDCFFHPFVHLVMLE
jgi:hypothetical protein